jgi:hypothetical protein
MKKTKRHTGVRQNISILIRKNIIKMFSVRNLYVYGLVVLMSAIPVVGTAGQNAFPKSASDVTMPVSGAVMHEQYVKTIGRMAYVWGWPMVNSFNRRAARHHTGA